MKKPLYVYIAGPYTHPDPVINTNNAIAAAEILRAHGYIPFVPHLTLFWHFLTPHEIDYWYEYDLAWLDKCDCLIRLPGESTGADNEVKYAREHGIDVYNGVSDLIEWEL